jgi:hypothetical protein
VKLIRPNSQLKTHNSKLLARFCIPAFLRPRPCLPFFAISPIGNMTFNGTTRWRVDLPPGLHTYNLLN